MTTINRRSFLAASAAFAAGPAFHASAALGAIPSSGEVDIVIVGAGAAGIAAARRVAAAGKRYAVIEAADRIGGRCVTDTRTFGAPFDRGAHRIHTPELNPLAQLAGKAGLEIVPASRAQKLRVGPRNAREGELEDFLSAVFRSNRAIADAGRAKTDMPAVRALPKDLMDWRPLVEFVLGPYGTSRDLSDISAIDFARAAERDIDAYCRQGYGALLAKLADGFPVQLNTAAERVEWLRALEIDTSKGKLRARAAIVTASTSVLAAGKIKFSPELPKRQIDAFNKLKLGSYDHIAVELPGNPLGLGRDELVFEKSDSARTGVMTANVSGSSVCVLDVGGRFGQSLAEQGQPAMVAFAGEWLGNLFGSNAKNAIKRTAVTRWNSEPWTLGAFSAAAPGGADARKILTEPIRSRVFFAGEAAHDTLWGTVGGAWESGTRAAEAALRAIGAPGGGEAEGARAGAAVAPAHAVTRAMRAARA